MPLASSKTLLEHARQAHYGIGGFNASNMEMVQAIVEAAEEEQAPVIVQISQGTIKYAGLSFSANLVKTAAEMATVPVVLHLDHGTAIEQNLLCLREGFTSLMYDGTERVLDAYRLKSRTQNPPFEIVRDCIQSQEAFEDNVRVTEMIAEIAHTCSVPVEAELGKIPRAEDFSDMPADCCSALPLSVRFKIRMLQADPVKAEQFVRLTNCDSLAIACGSIHGMKADIVPLDLGLIEDIAGRVNIPLVLHGSSGVLKTEVDAAARGIKLEKHEGSIREAIARGIAKINVSTELQLTFLHALGTAMERNPREKDLRKLFLPAKEALKINVRSLIRLFGSSGKADAGSSSRFFRSSIEHGE